MIDLSNQQITSISEIVNRFEDNISIETLNLNSNFIKKVEFKLILGSLNANSQ